MGRNLMNWFVPIAALAALAGCDNRSGLDGHHFDRKEWPAATMTVRPVEHPNLASFNKAAAQYPQAVSSDTNKVYAFSVISGSTCTIHYLDPMVKYEPQWLGHEIAHCFYGRWHD